jgi:putative ABC transport system permease protein
MKHFRKPRTYLIWENFLLALGALRDRGFRSSLTVTGVFIGVVIIVGVASVLNGFREGVIKELDRFGAENIYISRMPMMSMMRPDAEVRKRKLLTTDDAEALQSDCPALTAVTPVLPYMNPDLTATYEGEEMMGPVVRGAWASITDIMTVEIDEGRCFSAEENHRSVPVCFIGKDVVEALFPKRSALGKSITLQGHRLRVVGTMKEFPRALSMGEDSPEDSIIFVPYAVFRQIFPWNDEVFIMARAKPGMLPQAVEQIEEVLRRRRHVAWNDPNDFDVQTPDSILSTLDKITGAAVAVMFALSMVAFLVGGVGVMNVMLASVKERTREIGIRRAIGARRRDITWQFLIEAMALTGTGGVLGVVFGEALMYGIVFIFPKLPAATPMWARMFGFFGSVGVGLVFGLWPAVTAARLDPIKALRYE